MTPPVPDPDEPLFDQLVEWAGPVAKDWLQGLGPADRLQIVEAISKIAAIPIVQSESGAEVQFVAGKRVFNLRPLVIPTIVAILAEAVVVVLPSLASPLVPLLDLVHFAEKAGEIYRTLDDDEVDVFGAANDLYASSERRRSLIEHTHPTAKGVERWFAAHGYEVPENVEKILGSLVHKGALLSEKLPNGELLYAPTFLGKKASHG